MRGASSRPSASPAPSFSWRARSRLALAAYVAHRDIRNDDISTVASKRGAFTVTSPSMVLTWSANEHGALRVRPIAFRSEGREWNRGSDLMARSRWGLPVLARLVDPVAMSRARGYVPTSVQFASRRIGSYASLRDRVNSSGSKRYVVSGGLRSLSSSSIEGVGAGALFDLQTEHGGGIARGFSAATSWGPPRPRGGCARALQDRARAAASPGWRWRRAETRARGPRHRTARRR